MRRIADGVLMKSVPIQQHFEGYCQELNTITLSQDSVFIIGASRDRIVKVWMDFLAYIELKESFMKQKRSSINEIYPFIFF